MFIRRPLHSPTNDIKALVLAGGAGVGHMLDSRRLL